MAGPVRLEDGATEFFVAEHRALDALWRAVEAAADTGDATLTKSAFEAFDKAMRRHFDMEEQVLFPALEKATGMTTTGPTRAMRADHDQMRILLGRMVLVAGTDADAMLDDGDALLVLMQEHALKETGTLYPMAEGRIGDAWSDVVQRLAKY